VATSIDWLLKSLKFLLDISRSCLKNYYRHAELVSASHSPSKSDPETQPEADGPSAQSSG
ncbi:MAG TPA: hypothetical protein VMM57_12505, partial [Bacteroidota bacterium]|nr:hypothetical protein [Bacteroidota bacterium]